MKQLAAAQRAYVWFWHTTKGGSGARGGSRWNAADGTGPNRASATATITTTQDGIFVMGLMPPLRFAPSSAALVQRSARRDSFLRPIRTRRATHHHPAAETSHSVLSQSIGLWSHRGKRQSRIEHKDFWVGPNSDGGPTLLQDGYGTFTDHWYATQ